MTIVHYAVAGFQYMSKNNKLDNNVVDLNIAYAFSLRCGLEFCWHFFPWSNLFTKYSNLLLMAELLIFKYKENVFDY